MCSRISKEAGGKGFGSEVREMSGGFKSCQAS